MISSIVGGFCNFIFLDIFGSFDLFIFFHHHAQLRTALRPSQVVVRRMPLGVVAVIAQLGSGNAPVLKTNCDFMSGEQNPGFHHGFNERYTHK